MPEPSELWSGLKLLPRRIKKDLDVAVTRGSFLLCFPVPGFLIPPLILGHEFQSVKGNANVLLTDAKKAADANGHRHNISCLIDDHVVDGPKILALVVLNRPADQSFRLEGTPDGLAAAAEETGLINLTQPRSRSFRRRKAPIAIIALASVVFLAALNVMPIEGLAVLGVAAILLLRCMDAEEAWESINGSILVLVFAMLAIGVGLEKSGAIRAILVGIEPLLADSSPLIMLVVVYFLAVALTDLITNNAVAVVLTPIAIGLAEGLGVDSRPLLVAVMMGASASFATPVGYQTRSTPRATADLRCKGASPWGIQRSG